LDQQQMHISPVWQQICFNDGVKTYERFCALCNRLILKLHEKLITDNNSSAQNQTNITNNSIKLNAAVKGNQYILTNLISHLPKKDQSIISHSN